MNKIHLERDTKRDTNLEIHLKEISLNRGVTIKENVIKRIVNFGRTRSSQRFIF